MLAQRKRANTYIPPDVEDRPPAINWKRRCGIPIKYERYSLDTYQGNPTLVDLLKSPVHSEDSITLFGNTGCGKTHLAVGLLAEFIKKNTNAIFITVPELLLQIRASFGERDTLTEDEIIEKYTTPALLVLDDLGAEKTSDFSITTLYLIIDRRNRYGRKTIITTNLTDLKAVEDSLGARIASRLAESKIINIASMADWRKKRLV